MSCGLKTPILKRLQSLTGKETSRTYPLLPVRGRDLGRPLACVSLKGWSVDRMCPSD